MSITNELESQLDLIGVLEHWGVDTSYMRQVGSDEYRSPCWIHGGTNESELSLKMVNGRWWLTCFSHSCTNSTLFDWALSTGRTPRDILDDYSQFRGTTSSIRSRCTHRQDARSGEQLYLPSDVMNQFAVGVHRSYVELGYDRDVLTQVFSVRYCADADHPLYQRVVYPIRDKQGRIRSIQGRRTNACPPDATKYMFHPGFTVKDILYGQYEMAQLIRKSQYIVVTESPKSVMRGYQLGIATLALMGIRWTDAQAKQIASYGKRVVLVADADEPGINGMVELQRVLSRYVQVDMRVCPHADSDISDYGDRSEWMDIIRNGEIR